VKREIGIGVAVVWMVRVRVRERRRVWRCILHYPSITTIHSSLNLWLLTLDPHMI
jgi:hypothetical protein